MQVRTTILGQMGAQMVTRMTENPVRALVANAKTTVGVYAVVPVHVHYNELYTLQYSTLHIVVHSTTISTVGSYSRTVMYSECTNAVRTPVT